jgi:galactose oxidase
MSPKQSRALSALFALFASLLALALAPGHAAAKGKPVRGPSTVGQWSPVYAWPDVAVHLHMLPDGKVFTFADDDHEEYEEKGTRLEGKTRSFLVDIPPGAAPSGWSEIPNTRTNVFCSGHSFLPDGRLLVMGGHKGQDALGDNETNLLEFNTNWHWAVAPNMTAGRWYPTAVTLPSGDVLTVAGAITPQLDNDLPEVWDNALGSWRPLTSARLFLPLYPWLHVAPDGRVFVSGPDATTRFLNTSGTGAWSTSATRLGGSRGYGTGVMYQPGKVIAIGGGDPPKSSCEVIDLTAAAPAWRSIGSMRYARRQLNATLLPDGTVLVTGGTSGSGFNNAQGAVLAAEIWNPVGERWTTMASMAVPRLYHSTTILLPDGRVLSAGGGRPAAVNGGADNENAEIFSPPYLFKGARPAIASAPASAGFGATIAIGTTSAVSRVTLVRLSTSTHALNMGQRFHDLAFTSVAGGVNATLPPNANVCTPGHYLLFLLNANGVPSIGRVIQVGVPAGGRVAGAAGPEAPGVEPPRAERAPGHDGGGFRLGAPYPNPTAGGCEFGLTLPREARVQARVYDVTGRLVREVARGRSMTAGTHRLRWDGLARNGARASRGIYWIQVRFGSETLTRRVTLLN